MVLHLRFQQGRKRQLSALILLSALLPAQAFAACTDVATRITAAWDAYNEAEVEQATAELDAAVDELSCQTRLLTQDELFELFEFNALVEIGSEDPKSAQTAIIRAIGVDPERLPAKDNGAALMELHQKWQGHIAAVRVQVKAAGRRALYVDGLAIPPGDTVELVRGEHLVQIEEGDSVYSEVLDLQEHTEVVTTPRDAGATLVTRPLEVETAPTQGSGPVRSTKTVRRLPGRPASLGAGVGIGVVSGGFALAGFLLERQFAADEVSSEVGTCEGETCWVPDEVAAPIRQRARTINALYGTSYGLAGVSAVLIGVGIAPRKDGVAMNVSFALP